MPQRLALLNTWLAETLGSTLFDINPASNDASFRRYFRVYHQGESLIVMDAPPAQEDTTAFIRVAELLLKQGLTAPRILAKNSTQGFLLLSDLGDTPYLNVLTDDTADALYGDALQALLVMQQIDVNSLSDIPPYDHALLMQEMQLFRDWYLQGHLSQTFSLQEATQQDQALTAVFEQLASSALAQPVVFVHRDYHSRNLMRVDVGNPGIIDFQDAVQGPVTYDLVSLLRDCYIRWPRARVEAWALGYLRDAQQAGIVDAIDDETWLRGFDWMGVQRHLKAAGIFARLNLRDGKPGYLDDIPRTLSYVREVAGRYDELSPLLDFLPTDLPAEGTA